MAALPMPKPVRGRIWIGFFGNANPRRGLSGLLDDTLGGVGDLEKLVIKSAAGTPVFLRDIARVELVPDERRGIAELDGNGEVVAGIAMARYGQNALDVIHNLKLKIGEISAGLPEGVTLKAVYDRSDLIHRAIDNLRRTLIEERSAGLLRSIVSSRALSAWFSRERRASSSSVSAEAGVASPRSHSSRSVPPRESPTSSRGSSPTSSATTSGRASTSATSTARSRRSS